MYKWADYTIYDIDDGDTVNDFLQVFPDDPPRITIGKREYLRLPGSFDIETTRSGKLAYMYHGQFGVGHTIMLYRTWDQYTQIIQGIQQYLHLHKLRLIVWVANLSHEWMFIQYRHTWTSVFAKQPCQPLRSVAQRIEYREALSISGQGGLANLAKNYCKTKKAKGDLDYTKLRNYYTKLNKTEKGYTIADCAILLEFGYKMFELYCAQPGDKIPMTQTGICRKMVRDAVAGTGKEPQIKQKIRELYPKTQEIYNYLMLRLFRGGYTHANIYWASSDDVNQVIENVIGFDYTSSYPAVMLHDMCKYPYTRFITIHDLQNDGRFITDPRCNLQDDALILNITYHGLRCKTLHTIESDHKIITGGGFGAEGVCLDNGRIICADHMTVCQTELDYMIYCKFYEWDSIDIISAQTAKKGSLPKYLTQPLLDAYVKKQQLKAAGLDETTEYKNAKAIVNSYYGMCVQRLVFAEWHYHQEDTKEPWQQTPSRTPYWKMIKDQVLSPYWGIWVTAWARYKLLSTVAELDPDRDHFNVIYCDTDSIYMLDSPRNRQIIKEHNAAVHVYNKDLPPECHDLGEFDAIGKGAHYKFKTLGAKRYIKLHDGRAEVVVAGMRKGSYERAFAQETPPDGEDYCILKIPDRDDPTKKKEMYISEYDLFAHFRDGCIIDVDVSDKLRPAPTYTPYSEEIDGVCMQELSGVALIPVRFSITMGHYYKSLIAQWDLYRRRPVGKQPENLHLTFDDLDDFEDLDAIGDMQEITGDVQELPEGLIILGGYD
jgi:hypothetical protein